MILPLSWVGSLINCLYFFLSKRLVSVFFSVVSKLKSPVTIVSVVLKRFSELEILAVFFCVIVLDKFCSFGSRLKAESFSGLFLSKKTKKYFLQTCYCLCPF